MKLKEAIDLSKAAADDMDLQNMPRFAEAVRLGIEALKREQRHREWIPIWLNAPLPGETDE